jgi:hypothetical protein
VGSQQPRKIQFNTDDAVADELQAFAASLGVSVNAVLNILVRQTLAHRGDDFMASLEQIVLNAKKRSRR